MTKAIPLGGLALALLLAGCSEGEGYREQTTDIRVVESMDLARYSGRWFEVARFPNRFQKNCTGATHDYDTSSEGRFDVTITCRLATLAGPVQTWEGTARSVAPPDGALKIKFRRWLPWFFDGDYSVLAVAPDYSWAVAGNEDGTVGWILGRDLILPPEQMRQAYEVLWQNGYDLTEIYLTDQPGVGN